MERDIQITARAEEDVREIVAYIAARNERAYQYFEVEFDMTVARLARNPHIGHRYRGVEEEVLTFRVSQRFRRYLVFYTLPDARTLRIIRVLHGARDLRPLVARPT